MSEHHGPATDVSTFEYIFARWLPASGYALDGRPHFEVLPADYRPLDPDAREEIWIPVRLCLRRP
jgi:AraC family transcriptional regulator